jgi:SSS family solute:Na+ symporter
MFWYLSADPKFAVLPCPWPDMAKIPPFFIGFAVSLAGWFAGWLLDPKRNENSNFWPEAQQATEPDRQSA